MFIGIPEKGRNAGIALKEELPEDYETDFLLDALNGEGKSFSRTGDRINWIANAVASLDCAEFKEMESPFPRPVFTELQINGKLIESYESEPLHEDFDCFYQGLDQIVEEACSVNRIEDESLEELATEIVEEEGYALEELYGGEIKWGVINKDLETVPDTVLIPRNFPNLGIAAVKSYWNTIPEYAYFDDYTGGKGADTWSEEEILTGTSEEVAGVYIFVSGRTAEDAGLEYDRIPGFTSRLGKFSKMSQNQYKNSVKNRF